MIICTTGSRFSGLRRIPLRRPSSPLRRFVEAWKSPFIAQRRCTSIAVRRLPSAILSGLLHVTSLAIHANSLSRCLPARSFNLRGAQTGVYSLVARKSKWKPRLMALAQLKNETPVLATPPSRKDATREG